MPNSVRYNEMRRIRHILASIADRGESSEERKAVWDALRAYTIVMQLGNPREIYERMFSGSDVSDKLKADLRRLWIGPDIEPDDDIPFEPPNATR